MGKYTSLARQLEEPGAQKKGVSTRIDNTYKHSIVVDTKSSSVAQPSDDATPLRPYAVNAVIPCIHRLASDDCAVCSGYIRWLIADEDRFRRAQSNPESVRREFWRSVRGGA